MGGLVSERGGAPQGGSERNRPLLANRVGWVVLASVAALGLGGAASVPDGLLIGLPTLGHLAAVSIGLGLLAALAGGRAAEAGLGLLPVPILFALLPRWSGTHALSGTPLVALVLAAAVLAGARSGRRPRLFFPVVLAVYLVAAARVQDQVGPRGDEPHYLMNAESLWSDGDLAVEDDFQEGRYRAFHPGPLRPDYLLRGRGGVIYSLHSVGVSLLVLPAYGLGGYPAASFFIALLAALAARETRALLHDVLGRSKAAETMAWLVALAPPLLHFCGLVFTEAPAALIVALGLRRGRDLGRLSPAMAGALGLAVAFLPWMNVRYAPVSAVLLAYGLWPRPPRRAALAFLGAGIASGLALLIFHFALYGFWDPRRVYGRRRDLSLLRMPEGLGGLLLDQEFGLLVYAPLFALAAFGFAPLVRRARHPGLGALAVTLVTFGVAGAWVMWRGGWNPPARFLLPCVPALALSAAAAVPRGLGAPAALLAGWTLFTGLFGAWEPRLVHRDRDGTAPFFRERSGALEWTRLFPGYVQPQPAPDRAPLTLLWAVTLAAAALPRWWPGGATSLALATTGLAGAAALAASLAGTKSFGREAVRLVGKHAVSLPLASLAPVQEARWGVGDLDWGPLYEPHRYPQGAVLGGRLPLPPGRYALEVGLDRLWPAATPPTLTLQPAPHTSALVQGPFAMDGSSLTAWLTVPQSAVETTLRLHGGGPVLVRSVRLRPVG